MLKIVNVCAQFEKKSILQDVNLQVKKGEIHALLGPNGAGKSTLGRIILGDKKYTKTKGNILFEDKNFDDMEPFERAQAGFFLSFQSPPVLDGVSAKDLLFAAKKAKDTQFASSFRLKKELIQNLKNLHMSEEFVSREVHKGASGGERKKLEMASLLTLDTKLAFLDEIDSGIDVDTLKAIGASIKEFMNRGNRSVIVVSHTEKLLQYIKPTHFHVLCSGTITASGGKEIMKKIHRCGFCHFSRKTS